MVDLQEQVTRRRPPGTAVLLGIPGVVWLLAFMVLPLYAVAAVAFGTVDPILRTPVAAWNPLQWDFTVFGTVLMGLTGGPLATVFLRTGAYVLGALAGCILIGFPVAYYVAKYAGRYRNVILAALALPFVISYMLRMLAWVTLLQPDGYVNKFLSFTPFGGDHNWLGGSAATVVLGLIYGYIPFFILALYASLERLDIRLVDAARDLGADPRRAFRMVTLPLAVPGLLAASAIVVLPMCGDYYTNTYLTKGATSTEMIGNQIERYLLGSSQPQLGAGIVLLLMLFLVVFMAYYLRTVQTAERELSR